MELENTLNGGYNAVYEEVVTADCYKLKDLDFVPDIIFDLGANVGVFTRHARDIFPNAKIISVEPHIDNFVHLENFTKSDNIVFMNMAIGIGKIFKFDLPHNHHGAHESYISSDVKSETISAIRTQYWEESEAQKVTTESIMPDKLITNYLTSGQKSYLKLDIEGNENIIWNHKPSMEAIKNIDFISMELHFLARHWTDTDRENTYKMMESFNDTHDCEFVAPMFYAKRK
jgi:FkbM family methyltransferase